MVCWDRCVGCGAVYICKRVSPFRRLSAPPSPKGDGFFSGSCFAVAGVGGEIGGSLFMKASSPLPSPVGATSDVQPVPLGDPIHWGVALALVLFGVLAYNRYKESTHSFVWMPQFWLIRCPYGHCLSRESDGVGFFILLIFLCKNGFYFLL